MSALSAIQTLADIALSPLKASLEDEELDILDAPHSSRAADMVAFIRQNFQKKVCSNFVQEYCALPTSFGTHSQDAENDLCICGSRRKDHPNTFYTDQDMYMDDMDGLGIYVEELKPTDAFGQIKFQPSTLTYHDPAEYVRLADSSDAVSVLELLCSHWKLHEPDPPSLVISLPGKENLLCLTDIQKREIFNRGLIKAIKSTKGWLITEGLNSGVAKAVGSAVQEGQTLQWAEDWGSSNQKIGEIAVKCIGISTWSQIQNKDILINRNMQKLNTVDYLVDPVARDGDLISLNPHHSHFLLVDTGVSNAGLESQGSAEFRASLERQIALPKEENGLDVPVVCLLVEGGIGSVEQVLNSVKQGLPAVVCANSGRAADILAWTLGEYSRILECEDVNVRERDEYELRLMVKDRTRMDETLKNSDEAEIERFADMVVDICTFHEQITIFHIGEKSSLDEALLLSILDSQHKADPLKQLELAQKWNRADVARRILNDPRYFVLAITRNMNILMVYLMQALVYNQVDFVRLYLDSGVPLKKFLRTETLCQLYAETVIEAPYLWRRLNLVIGTSSRRHVMAKLTLQDIIDSISIDNVFKCFESIGHNFLKPDMEDITKGTIFSDPMSHLFSWAVILNRQELAILFWERSTKPLATAITGTVLCHFLSKRQRDTRAVVRQEFTHFKDRLEKLACGLAKEAFRQNPTKAVLLVKRPSSTWGNINSITLAAIAEDKKLLATECCQSAIKSTWKRGYSASFLRILYTVFLFFPVFVLEFDKTRQYICRCAPGACNCKRKCRHSDFREKSISLGRSTSSNTNKQVSYLRQNTMGENLNDIDALEFLPSIENLTEYATHKSSRIIQMWMKRIFIFYYSPVVKFITHTVFYCAFLVFYAMVVLKFLNYEQLKFTAPEWVLYFWQGTFLAEELRAILWTQGETLKDKFMGWWVISDLHVFNKTKTLSLLFSVIILIVRICPGTFAIAKAMLVINFIFFSTQIFKVYSVNGYLGPKVFMMRRMLLDLAMFCSVFFIFYISYSVSYHAFYKQQNSTIPTILRVGIWEIFGEVNDEALTEGRIMDACVQQVENRDYVDECSMREGLISVFLISYLFCTSILLVNMLIATFTHTFDHMQKNSKQIWKYQMYFLVEEFNSKPILPEPLIILEHAYLLIRHIYRICTKRPKNSSSETIWGRSLSKKEKHYLSVFESACRTDYLERKKKKCACTCGKTDCNSLKNKKAAKASSTTFHSLGL